METRMKKAIVPHTKELGIYFQKKRIENGYSQSDLSDFLGYTTSQLISKFERGLCSIKFQDLVKVAPLLKIGKEELINILVEEQRRVYLMYIDK